MKVTTAQWLVHRPVNQDVVYVTAVRYVIDGEEHNMGEGLETQALTSEGEWVSVEVGTVIEPTVTINGRDFHLNRDVVVEQIQELCNTILEATLEAATAGEVQS
jgi:hypothetical protein